LEEQLKYSKILSFESKDQAKFGWIREKQGQKKPILAEKFYFFLDY
jgi:hypothetical protein